MINTKIPAGMIDGLESYVGSPNLSSFDLATSEVPLGFLYNTKPIYRRHFSFPGPVSTDNHNTILYTKNYQLSFTIDTLLKLTGYITWTESKNFVPIPSYQKNNTNIDPVGGRIMWSSETNLITVNVTPTWLDGIIHIDMEYTKG